MPSPFPCSPMIRECSWKKTHIKKSRSCYHMETSQLICLANQLTGFYMTATLAFNKFSQIQIWKNSPGRYQSCQLESLHFRFDDGLTFIFFFIYKREFNSEPFKSQPHKMFKHTQTICRQQPTNCLSVFAHFVGLALKGFDGLIIHLGFNLLTFRQKNENR